MNKPKYTVSIDTWLMLLITVGSSVVAYITTGSFLDVYTAVFFTGSAILLRLDKERKND